MNAYSNRIRFEPPAHWRLIAHDGNGAVWLTLTSAADLERLEPGLQISQVDSSSHAVTALRASDHASFAFIDERHHTAIVESRPRARERIYVSRQSGTDIEIAAGLCFVSNAVRSATLSRRFVAIWFANAIGFSGMDHFLGCSPFQGYHLISQGLCAHIDLRNAQIATTLLTNELNTPSSSSSLSEMIENCKVALQDTISTATAHADVAVAECSGVIDSSLVAIVARNVLGQRFLGGVFADQPYYEFRLEKNFAQSVADYGGFELLPSNPSMAVCWAALRDRRMNVNVCEPSCLIPFWGQVLMGYHFVQSYRRPVIFTGLGGDRLFQMKEPLFRLPEMPTWLSATQWEATHGELQYISKWLSAPERNPSGYGFVNPWFWHTMDLFHPGAHYYSPLCARRVIAAFDDLRQMLGSNVFCAKTTTRTTRIQKPLAHAVFAGYLPEMLWLRRSKIDFNGLFYRFWLKSGRQLIPIVKRMAPHLEALGINSKILLKRVVDMTEGRHSADIMLNAVVTYSFWLDRFLTASLT